MCLAVFYNAQPRVPIYHDFLYYFGSLRIYIVSRSPIKPGNDIKDILVQNGIKENVIPKWMPDGFKLLDEISVYEFGSSGNLQVDAAYSDGTDFLSYSVIRHKSQIYSTLYEKDEGNVEVYTTNGIEHYIFSNLSVYTAAWCIDDLECSISTSLPKSDLTKAIDSIYEE